MQSAKAIAAPSLVRVPDKAAFHVVEARPHIWGIFRRTVALPRVEREFRFSTKSVVLSEAACRSRRAPTSDFRAPIYRAPYGGLESDGRAAGAIDRRA